MPGKFGKVMDGLGYSDSEIAHLANVDPKTVKAAKDGRQKLRAATKRALVAAVNPLLAKEGKKEIGLEIFI